MRRPVRFGDSPILPLLIAWPELDRPPNRPKRKRLGPNETHRCRLYGQTVTAFLNAKEVTVDFPIYGAGSRSLKKALVNLGTRGHVARDASDRVCVRALEGVSLLATEGERIGIVGANGAGKTTLLRVLAGIYEPTRGEVQSSGRLVPLFDPALGLNNEVTGYENMLLRGLLLGLSAQEIRHQVSEIAAFTELGEHLAMPIRTYSTGMMLRLAFAISTCVMPDILVMDEWMSVGDVHFLQKAEKRLANLIDRTKILILASHSENLIRRICTRAILLEKGRIVAEGDLDSIFARYRSA